MSHFLLFVKHNVSKKPLVVVEDDDDNNNSINNNIISLNSTKTLPSCEALLT